jgi:thiamine biosynthesis lipoprotein
VFREAREIAALTGGALDITVGPLVEAWGFGPTPTGPPPSEAQLAALRERVGWDRIELDEGASTLTKTVDGLRADLSAVAKGYAVDRVAEALLGLGETRLMVEVGGEVRTAGRNARSEPWRIGIERPVAGPGRGMQRLVPLSDLSIATSGGYRNYRDVDGQRLIHILDPRLGRPVSHALASVSVVAPSCTRADGLATALLVLGPEEGLALAEREGIAALLLVADGSGGFQEVATSTFAARTGSAQAGPRSRSATP